MYDTSIASYLASLLRSFSATASVTRAAFDLEGLHTLVVVAGPLVEYSHTATPNEPDRLLEQAEEIAKLLDVEAEDRFRVVRSCLRMMPQADASTSVKMAYSTSRVGGETFPSLTLQLYRPGVVVAVTLIEQDEVDMVLTRHAVVGECAAAGVPLPAHLEAADA